MLNSESRPEFDSLLSGLRDNFNPEGTFEEILVVKLATHLWQYRRLLIAEAAEIQKGSTFLEWEEEKRQEKDAQETFRDFVHFGSKPGLLKKMTNPELLDACLDLLAKLEYEIETNRLQSRRYSRDFDGGLR